MTLLRPELSDIRRPLRRPMSDKSRPGMRVTAVPLRLRSTIALALVSVAGVAAFGWPLLAVLTALQTLFMLRQLLRRQYGYRA